jgi:malate/lactate dehydrogenase
VEQIIQIKLTEEEQTAMEKSAALIRSSMAALEF